MHQKPSPKISYFKIILIVACTVGIILAGTYIVIASFFNIKEVHIINKNTQKNPPTLQGIDTLHEYNLILTDKSVIENYLKRSNPTIKKVEIEKELPDTITLVLTYYTPLALLKGDQGYFVISSDGTVLSVSHEQLRNLPLITYYELLNTSFYPVGSKINFMDIQAALTFLQSSLDLGLKITNIDINGSHMIALYSDTAKILFNQEKDVQIQKYQLETIVNQFRSENKNFKTLDLRFDKPVLVF